MAKWVTLDSNDRGWRFYCSACGASVYWPQPTRGSRPPRYCPYPTCPWCSEKMEVNNGRQDEN